MLKNDIKIIRFFWEKRVKREKKNQKDINFTERTNHKNVWDKHKMIEIIIKMVGIIKYLFEPFKWLF